MIRLIRRRLIIPRGDTGVFTIPVQGTVDEGDVAVFSLYDPLTRTVALEKKIILTSGATDMSINFVTNDTVNLKAKKYLWDIKIYHIPTKYKTEEGEIIEVSSSTGIGENDMPVDATEINSYYAAFSLPVCEIREVTQDVP